MLMFMRVWLLLSCLKYCIAERTKTSPAYKRVSNHSEITDRGEVEKNLHFVAFIAFRNEVKTGTLKAVKHLKEMGRKV
ncbi:Cation-transporting atpase [Perkinsus olseni]|uniref:Cation-transporting atpase n=1 Tax=Perkinsus olseni TaxID=32597 RepID=A0A7J6Q0J9_PEROL|nr:Cation-transporting atpase [Perkinsus olseni]